MKICIQCTKEFESRSNRAKFCSSACRIAAHRIVTKNPIVTSTVTRNTLDNTRDIPNWERLGYASVTDHYKAIIAKLTEDKDKILKFSSKKRLIIRFGGERIVLE